MNLSKIEKTAATIAGVIGLLALLLWGVPYYLKSQVHDLFVVEGTASPHPVSKSDIAVVSGQFRALQIQLVSMENRMIARDELFMQYLQRQADDPE